MDNLVFATNNAHKIKEISEIIGEKFNILGLKDLNCFDDIPETGNTLEENALQKSRYIFNKFGVNCFADDTGLEIEALDGRPGVFSARYAGEGKDFDDNMNMALGELLGIENRKAKFRTVISLIIDRKEYFFEGCINGIITKEKRGKNGFGYDPIFKPDGYNLTFAEMDSAEKNRISHRGLAMNKLIEFLKNYTH